jgi:CspA family cold shock protein
MRISGTVAFYNAAKGYGFIRPDEGGKDVFMHATALEAAEIAALSDGDRVSFVLEDDKRGRGKQAGQLRRA